MIRLLVFVNLVAAASFSLTVRDAASSKAQCRLLPGDASWPLAKEWTALNKTVGGRLIATTPIAHVCHGADYNQAACDQLKARWDYPETHMYSAGEFDAPYWQNQTCDPYTPVSQPCTLGNYASFSINVSSASDVVAGIQFAKKNNIRLTVKNTGHDYLGKSTGKGALSFWTANLKGTTFIANYTSPIYKGPALKIAAGMVGGEVYQAVHKLGYTIVGGDCPSVGIAGGYSAGAGHSPLTGLYGMGADNVLEWEVVTPTGQHIIAKPDGEHADLYWAMSGGGGGTWGVVLSMTSRLHPETTVGGASLAITAGANTSVDALWGAIDAFHAALPPIVDTGATITYQLTNTSFTFYGATAPGQTGEQFARLLKPYLGYLDRAGLAYNVTPTTFSTYYEHMDHYFGPLPLGVFPISQLTSGRLVHRDTITASNASRVALVNAFRTAVADGHFYLALMAFNQKAVAGNLPHGPPNAVLPSWRESIVHAIVVGPWDWTVPRAQMLAREDELTGRIMPALEKATPGAGMYLNEANFRQPDWQEQFYGVNYARLSGIKKRVDPDHLFWARTAVGSERWAEDGEGRLCRV